MLEVSTARALITTSLTDGDLEEVIAREEAWLQRRIGDLSGERTERFVGLAGDEVLLLRRSAMAATVEDDSGAIDVSDVGLRVWSDVSRLSGSTWNGDVLVSYVPADEEEVIKSLITLVRLTVNESAYAGQSAGGYSYSVDPMMVRQQRWTAWRSLLRPSFPTSVRYGSPIHPAGGSRRSVESVYVGP